MENTKELGQRKKIIAQIYFVDVSNVFSIFILVKEANFTFSQNIKFKLVRSLNVIPLLHSCSNVAPVLLGN